METILNSNNDCIDKEVAEKLSKEVSSYIIEQLKNNMDNSIEERARLAAWQIYEEIGLSQHSVDRVSEIIAEKILEQKAIDDAELSKLKSVWGNETQVNRRCYIKGYQDAVEKSCELLREIVECGVHPSNAYGFADRFRKTLEEQLWK